jgi:hypothetical protein
MTVNLISVYYCSGLFDVKIFMLLYRNCTSPMVLSGRMLLVCVRCILCLACFMLHHIYWCLILFYSLYHIGESPAPFTQITNKEICDGVWMPRVEKHLVRRIQYMHSYVLFADFLFLLQEWAKQYTSSLEAKGRYTLIIWPEHCIVSERHVWCLSLDSLLFVIWCVFQIGTNGHNVFPALNDSLQKWSQVTFGRLRSHEIDSLWSNPCCCFFKFAITFLFQTNMKTVNYSRKGEECLTEVYTYASRVLSNLSWLIHFCYLDVQCYFRRSSPSWWPRKL